LIFFLVPKTGAGIHPILFQRAADTFGCNEKGKPRLMQRQAEDSDMQTTIV
jgi:hypothetical protein